MVSTRLDPDIKNVDYIIYDPLGTKLLQRMWLEFNHLREQNILWKSKVRNIIFYAPKITSPFAQRL